MNQSAGFRYMIEDLNILSSSGRKMLLDTKMMTSYESISAEIERISEIRLMISENKDLFDIISHKIIQLRDIHSTITLLESGNVLSDIDLFEIKQFAILNEDISRDTKILNITCISFCDLSEVVSILDPEAQGIPHFYIYGAYSSELQNIREKIKKCDPSDNDKYNELRFQEQIIENNIRAELTLKILPYAKRLKTSLNTLSYFDILIAKSSQSINLNLCKPELSDNHTEYHLLFNPQIKEFLSKQNKTFQPVDIELFQSPTLITGANMGGKTVLLNTLFLSQYLFQFGFYIPAVYAKIVPVDEIIQSHEENNPDFNGLSSFAVEMLNINKITDSIKSGKKVLALIDELARTTNPDEGKSIVRAMVDFLYDHKVISVLTTHYSGITNKCRKLRVKGLMHHMLKEKVGIEELNKYMDYSLISSDSSDVPADGLKIAEILGVDQFIINKAKVYFQKLED